MKRAKQRAEKRAADAESARTWAESLVAFRDAAQACIPVLERFAGQMWRCSISLHELRKRLPPWHMGVREG